MNCKIQYIDIKKLQKEQRQIEFINIITVDFSKFYIRWKTLNSLKNYFF